MQTYSAAGYTTSVRVAMQSLVSLEGYDPELRSYLAEHKWPAIMEVIFPQVSKFNNTENVLIRFHACLQALLTGLAVMLPCEPWKFVQEKLEYLRNGHITDIQW